MIDFAWWQWVLMVWGSVGAVVFFFQFLVEGKTFWAASWCSLFWPWHILVFLFDLFDIINDLKN